MNSRPAVERWILFGALAVFLLYTLSFLYFFVDDEGIPFVYAQNLLRGRGLIYTGLEGRIEGYSDFLNVLFDAAVLGFVHALKWSKFSVFFIGKAAALSAGAVTIAIAFSTMRRSPDMQPSAIAAGLGFLALAGPLAVWSCSSLETAPFALLVAVMTFALCAGSIGAAPVVFDRVAAVAGGLLILERIDGAIYAAAMVAAFMITAPRARRVALLVRVALPLGSVFGVYHSWRLWYFGDLLSAPLYAKVLYKFRPATHVVMKLPDSPYVVRFVQVYGWPAAAIAGAAAAYAAWRDRFIRPLLLATALLTAYVSLVGDWMFGFRFFAPLMPLFAVVLARASVASFQHRRLAGWIAAGVVVGWCGVSATAFERQYEEVERKPNWLFHASSDRRRYFGNYYRLVEAGRRYIGQGATVAYNQAGFVPFMLDWENIDNLGICSRFYAKLPSTDIFFTEVGRFSPLTNKPSIDAAEAYLLYLDVPFVIERSDLLRANNDGREPKQLMGGYYEAVAIDKRGDGIYRRTDRDASAYQNDPRLFFENVAHVSYVRTAVINGESIAPPAFASSLRFLRHDTGKIVLEHGTYTLDVRFGDKDIDVSEVDVNRAVADAPVFVQAELRSADGFLRHAIAFDVTAHERDYVERLPAPVKVSGLSLRIDGAPDTHVLLTDVRVQGQTPELSQYIREQLRFPPVH